MKIIQLSNEETLRTGFTHKAIISSVPETAFPAGDFTAAATTQTYTLMTLFSGHIVRNAAYKAVTFLSGGAISAATLAIGFTGTVAGYAAATNVFTGGTPFLAGAGASLANAPGHSLVAASAILATLTTTTANVVALTAGEVHIYWAVADMNRV